MSWASLALILLSTAGLACAPRRGTIGAIIGQQSDGRLTVRAVPPGLAAARAGLREGDEILLIDGVDVRRFDARAVHDALSGEVGEPVKLTVVRGDRVIRITVERTPATRWVQGGAAAPATDAQ